MSVIGTEPLWYRRRGDSDWVEHDEAQDYENYNSNRERSRGNFIENLLTYSHITTFGSEVIRVYVGTSEADNGINYNFIDHPNVEESLRTVGAYQDFLQFLKQAGYDATSEVATDAITRLQEFVDNANA